MVNTPNSPMAGSRAARLLRLLQIVVVVTSLEGCSLVQNLLPKSPEYVDRVRAELEIDALGEFQVEDDYIADAFSDSKPTYSAIVAGDDAVATLETRLVERGYDRIRETVWEKSFENEKVVPIHVVPVKPGDEVELSGGVTAEVEASGVWIFIQG